MAKKDKQAVFQVGETATALRDLISDLSSKEKDGDYLGIGDDANPADVTWVPTRSILFNWVTGGGIPLGRIVEIYGESSHGKSTLAMMLAASVQDAGGIVGYLDSEVSYDSRRSQPMGIDPRRFIYAVVSSVKRAFSRLTALLQATTESEALKGLPKIFIWDTVSQTPVDADYDEEKNFAGGMMDKPKQLWRGFRTIPSKIAPANAALIAIGQPIISPGQYQATKDTAGRAVHFASSIRIEVRRTEFIKGPTDSATGIGIKVQVKTVKNKLAPPQRTVNIPLMHDVGFDPQLELFFYAAENHTDLLSQGGGWWTLKIPGEEPVKFRAQEFKTILSQNPALETKLRAELVTRLEAIK